MPASFINATVNPGNGGTGLLTGPFPRVANVNGYGSGGSFRVPTPTAATFARHDLIITSGIGLSASALRAAAPNAMILFYQNMIGLQVSSIASGTPFGGLTIYPGWWLTTAGTRTVAAIASGDASIQCGTPITAWPSPSGTAFPVLVSSQDLSTHEVMVVTSYSLSGSTYTLNVTRGNWNSTATAFGAGARVGALTAPANYGTTFFLNVTPNCRRDGSNRRWIDYLATVVQNNMATYPEYDGVFFDSCNTYYNPSVNAGDADMNNTVDPFGLTGNTIGGDGATTGMITLNGSGAAIAAAPSKGIYNGIKQALKLVRQLASNAPFVIMTNGNGYPPWSDGMYHEQFVTTSFSGPPTFAYSYKMQNAINVTTADSNRYPATIINPCVWTTSGGAETGSLINTYSYNYQTMRFGLAASTMGNGYYAYDWYTFSHGQTWIFDEYVGAQGTCLTSTVNPTDTSLTVRSTAPFNGLTPPFAIRVPHAVFGSVPGSAGFSTTTATTITGGTTTQIVVASATNIVVGDWLIVSGGGSGVTDYVYVTAVSGTTITIGAPGPATFPTSRTGTTNIVSGYVTNMEDEHMTVTAVPDGTHLTVTRSDSIKGHQIAGTAVITDAQIAAGRGWLGQALGAPTNNLANLGAAVFSEGFESPAVPAGTVVAQAPTGWTFNATVAGTPAQATCYGDGSTFAPSGGGTQSLLVWTQVNTVNNGAFSYFNIKLTRVITMALTSGNPVTLAFWAKGDQDQEFSIRIFDGGGTSRFTQHWLLTKDWAPYYMTFNPGVGSGSAWTGFTQFTIQLEFSGDIGRYWLDNLAVYNGDVNIWYRQFQNGLVVLNGTDYNVNDTTHGQGAAWVLPAIVNGAGQANTRYQRLSGSQDPTTNNGAFHAAGSTLSIPSMDALFLLKVP